MAEKLLIRVKEARVEQKISNNTGKPYDVLTIIDEEGSEFTGFVNDKTIIPEVGDTLDMTYQEVELKSGTKRNIVSQTKTTEMTKSQTKRINSQMGSKNLNTSSTPSSGFNNKGARVGGILHDAVAIAVYNAGTSKKQVNLGEVEAIAEALLDLAQRLEG